MGLTFERDVDGVKVLLEETNTGRFIASSPDVPELATHGRDEKEAIENVHDALGTIRQYYTDSLLSKPLDQ